MSHPLVLAWLVAWTLITFLVYGLDKAAAKLRGPRIPEWVLNLLALTGGAIGGWLGLVVFHHKTNARRHPVIWLCLGLGTVEVLATIVISIR